MNTHEMFGRQKKVDKLLETLHAYNITLRDVLDADENDWAMLAEAARVNLPSVTTRNAIIEIMRREAVEADNKAEQKWEESQEYGGNRCPERE